MSETVHNVTSLPKSSALKKVAKRVLVAVAITGLAAAVYSKVNSGETDTVNEPQA